MEKQNGRRKEAKIPVSVTGKPYVPGTHVEFMYKRRKFTGIVEKQLQNSAIIVFDPEFSASYLALELKQRIVISYTKIKLLSA